MVNAVQEIPKTEKISIITFPKYSDAKEFKNALAEEKISISNSAEKIIDKLPFGTTANAEELHYKMISVEELTGSGKKVSLEYFFKLMEKKHFKHFPIDALPKMERIPHGEIFHIGMTAVLDERKDPTILAIVGGTNMQIITAFGEPATLLNPQQKFLLSKRQ